MIRRAEIQAAWRLMRPDQWPILSVQFMISLLLVSPAARGGGCWLNPASGAVLVSAWVSWVVLLNGGTLAFNSAFDRDTGPIAFLADPPAPPPWLGKAALVLMMTGVLLAWLVVGDAFALVVGICVLLSVAYSHPWPRLKKRPGLDLLVNMLGYGAGTTLAGILAGQAAYFGASGNACQAGGWRTVSWPGLSGSLANQFHLAWAQGPLGFVVGFGLLFGSLYPLTQIYQIQADQQRGDNTLCTRLGVRKALVLSLVLGLAAAAAFAYGLQTRGTGWAMVPPMIGWLLWQGHLWRWRRKEPGLAMADQEKNMYRALNLWALMDATLLAAWFL